MKKKFLYGALAIMLVALNVFVFSTASSKAAVAASGSDPYQSMAYCKSSLVLACTSSPTAWHCRVRCSIPNRPKDPGSRGAE